MPAVKQASFAGGEIDPRLLGRADQVRYATGLRTCRNFLVTKGGQAVNRAGTEYICDVFGGDTGQARQLRFAFSDEDTYVIVASDQLFRLIRNDAEVAIPSLDAAEPWSSSVTYVAGDVIDDGGTLYYCRRTSLNVDPSSNAGGFGAPWSIAKFDNVDFEVGDIIHEDPGFPTYICIENLFAFGMGVGLSPPSDPDHWRLLLPDSAGGVLGIVTPYAHTDLRALQYVQSGDVVTIVHPTYPQRELRRRAPYLWDLDVITFTPSIIPPAEIHLTGTAGSDPLEYAVTSVPQDGTFESVPGTAKVVGSGATAESQVVTSVTDGLVFHVSGGHPFQVGDDLVFAGFAGTTPSPTSGKSPISGLNGKTLRVSARTSTTFRVSYVTFGVSTGGYTGSGTVTKNIAAATGLAKPAVATPITVAWDQVDGAYQYNIYRRKNGVYGFVGSAVGTTFKDDGIEPDTSITPPLDDPKFSNKGNYPSTVAYFQQRIGYGNSINAPERVDLSAIGDYHNFTRRFSIRDDDPLSFTPSGERVNAVRHLVTVGGRLAVLTAGAEWTVDTSQGGALTPTSINLREQGSVGSNALRPVVFEATALYVTARSGAVRALSYDLASDGYQGQDLTVFAAHLFEARSLVAWDYARLPYSIVWSATDDGALLGMTYVREHEIIAWHRHDTGDGDTVEDVLSMPDGQEDAAYLLVRRTINGVQKRYIEKMATRHIDDITDAIFLDSSSTYDGENTTAKTLTLSGGTTWEHGETQTLTASASTFVADDVGNEYRITVGDVTIRFTVTVYTSETVVTVRPDKTVPAELRSVAILTWSRAVDEISGLGHLEGRTVGILADGFVEEQKVVTSGAITLSRPAAKAQVGLPITADLELLDLEDPNGQTLLGARKNVVKATILAHQSRGFYAGTDADHLKRVGDRRSENWDAPPALITEPITLTLSSTWDNNGRLFIRQTDPLPLEVLAVVRDGQVGDVR